MPRGKRNKSKPNVPVELQNQSSKPSPPPPPPVEQAVSENEEIRTRLASAKERLEKVQQVIDKLGHLQDSTSKIIADTCHMDLVTNENKQIEIEKKQSIADGKVDGAVESQTLKKKRNRNKKKKTPTGQDEPTDSRESEEKEVSPEIEPKIELPVPEEAKVEVAVVKQQENTQPSNTNTAKKKKNKKNKNKNNGNTQESEEKQTSDGKSTTNTNEEPKEGEETKKEIEKTEKRNEENDKSCEKLWTILDEGSKQLNAKETIPNANNTLENNKNTKKRNKKKNQNENNNAEKKIEEIKVEVKNVEPVEMKEASKAKEILEDKVEKSLENIKSEENTLNINKADKKTDPKPLDVSNKPNENTLSKKQQKRKNRNKSNEPQSNQNLQQELKIEDDLQTKDNIQEQVTAKCESSPSPLTVVDKIPNNEKEKEETKLSPSLPISSKDQEPLKSLPADEASKEVTPKLAEVTEIQTSSPQDQQANKNDEKQENGTVKSPEPQQTKKSKKEKKRQQQEKEKLANENKKVTQEKCTNEKPKKEIENREINDKGIVNEEKQETLPLLKEVEIADAQTDLPQTQSNDNHKENEPVGKESSIVVEPETKIFQAKDPETTQSEENATKTDKLQNKTVIEESTIEIISTAVNQIKTQETKPEGQPEVRSSQLETSIVTESSHSNTDISNDANEKQIQIDKSQNLPQPDPITEEVLAVSQEPEIKPIKEPTPTPSPKNQNKEQEKLKQKNQPKDKPQIQAPQVSPRSKNKGKHNQKQETIVKPSQQVNESAPELIQPISNIIEETSVPKEPVSSEPKAIPLCDQVKQPSPDKFEDVSLEKEAENQLDNSEPTQPATNVLLTSSLEESFTVIDLEPSKESTVKPKSGEFVEVSLNTSIIKSPQSNEYPVEKEAEPATTQPVAKERSKSKKEQKQNRKKSNSAPPDKPGNSKNSTPAPEDKQSTVTDPKNVQGSGFAPSANLQLVDRAESLGKLSSPTTTSSSPSAEREDKNTSPMTNKRNKEKSNMKQVDRMTEGKTHDVPEKTPQEKLIPQCSAVRLLQILQANMILPSTKQDEAAGVRKSSKKNKRSDDQTQSHEKDGIKLDENSNEIPDVSRKIRSPPPKKALPPLPPLVDDDEEFFEYTFTPREVFICSVCHICKKSLTDYIHCKLCQMVFYCSEDHLNVDHAAHKSLCEALQEIAKKRGGHIYNNARILNDDDFRCLRVHTLNTCENMLHRQLQPYERETLLFPRICATNSCREWRTNLLTQCPDCGQVAFCMANSAHLPDSHKKWCKVYKLYKDLVVTQKLCGRIEPSLPSKILSKPYHLPGTLDEVFKDLYRNYSAIKDECVYATLTQLATAPLTTYFSSQKCDQQIGELYTIHLVGAELQFEADTLDKWETFFLHLVPQLVELRVVFVGPELNMGNLPLEILSRMRMCRTCRQNCRAVKFDFQCGKLYHDFAKSSAFTKPDMVCFFNAGLYRVTGFNGVDTWPDTIQSAAAFNCPIVVTSYTEFESPKDLKRLQDEAKRELIVVQEPSINAYTSQRPERNFISDEIAPMIFKNFYCFIVK